MKGTAITWRSQLVGLAFASPYIVGFLGLLVLPLAVSLVLSFCNYSLLNKPMAIGWDNYRNLLTDEVFYKVLWNTLIYSICSVPLSLTASVALALLLNRPMPGRAFFRTVVFLPSLVPVVAGALLWQWVLNGEQGLLNVFLWACIKAINRVPAYFGGAAWITASPPNWLVNERLVMPVIIFLTLYSVGNTVIIFLAGLQDIPTELYESASLDGANGFRRMWHITLPMLSPIIFFNLVMGIIGSWQIFALPAVMVPEGGPNRAGYFYSQYLYDAAFLQGRMGVASAMAWIQFLIVLLATLVVIATSRKWVHYR